jgi:hypothetical protein
VALPLRNAFTESVAPWIQAVPKMMGGEGNTDPLAMQLHPFIRAIVESWSQKDLFTKQDLKRPELGKPFAKGTPLVPAGWQAEANQNPWLARTLVPFLTNPITVHALNRAAYSLGGGQARSAPVAAFGSYRPYTQSGRADDLFAMQVLGLLTRQTPYETDPSALLQLLAAQPAAAAAPEAAADAKKRVSKAREAARVEGRSSTR